MVKHYKKSVLKCKKMLQISTEILDLQQAPLPTFVNSVGTSHSNKVNLKMMVNFNQYHEKF